MNFVLWVCRSMHIVSVVIWLGGLMFQSAVLQPVLQADSGFSGSINKKVSRRFIGFIWMSVWTMLVTGVIMMLLSPRFLWFQYNDRWSAMLGFKQLIFVLMVFYSIGYARMLKYLDSPSSNGGFNEKAELYRHRVDQFRRINIVLGIVAMFLGAALSVYA